MQQLRVKVKKEVLLWDDYAPEGEEEFTLNVGEEYDVRRFDEEQKNCRFTLPDEVYVSGHENEDEGVSAWIQMAFDSEEEFWEYFEEVNTL